MSEREIGIAIGLALGVILSAAASYLNGFFQAWRQDRQQEGRR